MKFKKLLSLTVAFALSLSLLTGIGNNPTPVNAALPSTAGLYMTEWVEVDWNSETDSEYVITKTDDNGNVVMADHNGNLVPYRDSENPEYLTKGIEEGWGFEFSPVDRFWFDYVDGTKVTHVTLDKLTFTHLDGTPCTDHSFTAADFDSRVIDFIAGSLDPVVVTYTGATVNNKIIIQPKLAADFYTSAEKSLASYISDDVYVVEGKTKDVYLHLTDTWEDARFNVNEDDFLQVGIWNEDKGEEDILKGTDAAAYATVTPVSTSDPHNLIYKVTLNGKLPEGTDGYNVNCSYKEYNANDLSDTWEDQRRIYVRPVEGNSLMALDVNWGLGVKGSTYVVKDENAFNKETWQGTMLGSSLYTAFKYIDADGNSTYVTNPADLTFYETNWDDATDSRVIGAKIDPAPVTVTRVDETSPVLEIKAASDRSFETVVGYKDVSVDANACNSFFFGEAKDITEGFYNSTKAAQASYITDILTDSLEDINVYYAYSPDNDWIKSVTFKGFTAVDEKGSDITSKVTVADNGGVTFDGKAATESVNISIPAGTVLSGTVIKLKFDCVNGNNETEDREANLFVRYQAPANGKTFVVNGVTYSVTGKDTVSVKSVKKKATKVTIPATVYSIYKVTGIAAKAMSGCNKLKTITVKSSNIKSVGSNAFKGVKKSCKASVPKAKKAAYKKLFKKGGYKGKVK